MGFRDYPPHYRFPLKVWCIYHNRAYLRLKTGFAELALVQVLKIETFPVTNVGVQRVFGASVFKKNKGLEK
jgi:hypothetical protein